MGQYLRDKLQLAYYEESLERMEVNNPSLRNKSDNWYKMGVDYLTNQPKYRLKR